MVRRFASLNCCLLMIITAAAWAQEKKPAEAPGNRGTTPAEKDPNRHQNFMAHKERLIQQGGTQLVFIGDSITDGWRNGDQRDIFDDYFGKYHPYNIGISGDQTQHVLWRIEHGELDGISPKVAVIMIGTNNLGNMRQTPQETIDGVTAVVKAVEQKVPNIKILLLGIFPRANKADDPFRAQIKQVNDAISKLDDGGKHVKYLDIGGKFLDPDGTLPRTIMPDYLHPNVKGYQIWAEAIKPSVDEMEKE
jgi:lysophospholipase L1-like esterase